MLLRRCTQDCVPFAIPASASAKRCQIYALLKSGRTRPEVARQIGVHPTITKEIKRNTGRKGYRYKQAQEKASARRAAASSVPRKMTPSLIRDDRGETDAGIVEPRANQRLSEERGAAVCQPRTHLSAYLEEQAKWVKSLVLPAPQRQGVQ
jgi:hypothetical protein